MPKLVCDGRELEVGADQTVLDAMLAAGLEVQSSCRAGACQACLVQATAGTPPAAAQAGLKPALKQQGFFLACQARLESDLELSLQGAAALEVPARVAQVSRLAPDVLRVMLQPKDGFSYRAGQFLTLVRADGVSRAYSLASLPSADGDALELHVRVLPGGVMSNWLASGDAVGIEVRLRGPNGECFYTGEKPDQPLVLAGTGTGLSPLWGILRDALSAKHAGPIELWHGARGAEGLYLRDELKELARAHPNFTYRACVLEGDDSNEVLRGPLDDLLLRAVPTFKGRRVYLCGDAALVARLKRRVFLAGANLPDISADPFLGSVSPSSAP